MYPVYQGEMGLGGWPTAIQIPEERIGLPVQREFAGSQPIAFADLVFDADAVQVKELDFKTPFFGENRSPLTIRIPEQAEEWVAVTSVKSAKMVRVSIRPGSWPCTGRGRFGKGRAPLEGNPLR